MRIIIFILCLIFSTVSQAGLLQASLLQASNKTPDARLQVLSREPNFSEVLKVVLQVHEIQPAVGDRWARQMKWAPLLPSLYVGYDHSLKSSTTLSVTENISVTSNAVNVGPADNDWDYNYNTGNTLRFRAVWDLDELVFHSAEFNRSRELRDLVKTKLSLSDYTFNIYAARKKLLAQYSLRGNRTHDEQIKLLTERIDALTNNQFTERWWKR